MNVPTMCVMVGSGGGVLRQSYIVGGTSGGGMHTVNWRATTFTTGVAYAVTSVKLLVYRIGSPGTVTVSIRAVNVSGEPTGADLCSGTFNGDSVTTDPACEWVEVQMSTNPTLAAATEYAICPRCAGSGANQIVWRFDSTGAYADGATALSADSGVTWDATAPYDGYDYLFEVWGS